MSDGRNESEPSFNISQSKGMRPLSTNNKKKVVLQMVVVVVVEEV
jgi:hypothetical protein